MPKTMLGRHGAGVGGSEWAVDGGRGGRTRLAFGARARHLAAIALAKGSIPAGAQPNR